MSDDDLFYRPPADGPAWLQALTPRTLLCVGATAPSDLEPLRPIGAAVRSIEGRDWTRVLHQGWYAYRDGADWHAVAMLAGLAPSAAEAARYRFSTGGHLVVARSLHESAWAGAATLSTTTAQFALGDLVRPEDARWYGRIREVAPAATGHQYRVEIDGALHWYAEAALAPVAGDPHDPAFWLAQPPAGAAQLALTLTWTKLRHPLTDTVYSFAATKTLFRAYQFTPVLKLLGGSSGRLLIADEVGLGKTIEAGLIWSELEQRMPVHRALVVAPAPLTLKWRAEMERRFDRRLRILRPADLETFADAVAAGVDAPLQGIISLESLRTADAVLERLADLAPRLDLVIVDEAHDLRNRGTKSHTVGSLLADWADYLVLLSATPLNLGSADLFHLISLLDEGAFPDAATFAGQLEPNRLLAEVARGLLGAGRRPARELLATLTAMSTVDHGRAVTQRPEYAALCALLDTAAHLDPASIAHARRLLTDLHSLGAVLTRTRKADVAGGKAIRVPQTIDIEWTEPERAFYDAVQAWYTRRAERAGAPPGFAAQMPLRQAASCIPAAQQAMRRDGLLAGEALADALVDALAAGTDEIDESDGEPESNNLDGLDLSVLARPITVDTKFDRTLTELLAARAAGLRQMMIFSFFRGTLSYLADRLAAHFTVRVMDGSVPMAVREDIMRGFRAGEFEILLLSQVGAEGLDFEFCNVLVNYDLPWNPMEVEQRIGRLDRFGQRHEKIFIYNIRVPGTIESDIFGRLYDRINLFHRSIGGLEPILRETDLVGKLLDPRLSAADRADQVERVAVAVEQRAHDLARLEQSRGVLAGIDSLLVDGLTEHGLGHGRYLGPVELRTIVGELLRRTDASMTRPDAAGRFELRGSPRLAQALLASSVPDGGSRYPRATLAGLLRDEQPIPMAHSGETAAMADLDLLGSRHPLVRLALAELSEQSLALRRFGAVGVPGLPTGQRYLVTVDLAATTGLRPLLELWATAVRVDSGALDADAGDALLTALADGALANAEDPAPPAKLTQLWAIAAAAAQSRRAATETDRARINESLVDTRIVTQRRSIDLKLTRAGDLLAASMLDRTVRRITEGRVRELRRRRETLDSTVDKHRGLTVTLQPVAIVLVTGR